MTNQWGVTVAAGADYAHVPSPGNNLLPADTLTNPDRWAAAGFGYDNIQPAPVPVAGGMRLTWDTLKANAAIQGVFFDATAGTTYTLAVTATAGVAAGRWRASIGWNASTEWAADGQTATLQMVWTAPETRTYLWGVETLSPTTGPHTVTAIGVWDHTDPANVWPTLPLDDCRVELPVKVTHGRSGAETQPDAPTCEFTWWGADPPGRLGGQLAVTATVPAAATWADAGAPWAGTGWTWDGGRRWAPRFVGTITSLTAVEQDGQVQSWKVQGTGRQALLAAIPVRLDRPEESDTQRVIAIGEAAGIDVVPVGPSGLTLRADSIDRPALDALHEVAKSAGGLVWQDPDGTVRYGTLGHRDSTPARTLPCQVIGDGVEWTQDMSTIVNHVVLKWGDPEEQDTWRDDPSIRAWGWRGVEVTTLAADRSQAGVLAALIVARRAQPWWRMPGVMLDWDTMSPAEAKQAHMLAVSEQLLLPIPTQPGPTPAAAARWIVEGWVEQWDSDGHTQQVAVSEASRSVAAGITSWAAKRDSGPWSQWAAMSWNEQLAGAESTR